MRLPMIVVMTCSVLIISCAGAGGDVRVLEGDAAVARGASVAWAPLAARQIENGDPRIDNDLIRQRIGAAVETAREARGHRFVQDPSEARYIVSYHIGLQNRQDYRVDSMAAPSGAVCGWRGCVGGYG